MEQLKHIIETAWDDRSLLQDITTITAIEKVIALLDSGDLRVAEPVEVGWKVNEWVKKKQLFFISQQRRIGNFGGRYVGVS